MGNMPETTPDEPLSQRLRLAIMAVVESPNRIPPSGPRLKALIDVGDEASRILDTIPQEVEGRPHGATSRALLAAVAAIGDNARPEDSKRVSRLSKAAKDAVREAKDSAAKIATQGRAIAARDETVRHLRAQLVRSSEESKRLNEIVALREGTIKELRDEARSRPIGYTGPFTPDGLLKAERDRLKVELESALARANESEKELETLRGQRDADEAKRLRETIAARDRRISDLLGEIAKLTDERDGARSRAHDAEGRAMDAANKAEVRALRAANKADRRADERDQLARAVIELGQIIGEERHRVRTLREAMEEERERADHQEARKEEQIAKLAGTLDERIEADERVKAWEQIVKHRAFVPCYEDGARLLPAMVRRLDQLLAGQADQ